MPTDFWESLPWNARFLDAWQALAEQGYCDEFGGMQFMRISQEWVAAGCPLPAAEFIFVRANDAAPGSERGIFRGEGSR
jgi:hypothetical protein